VTGRFFGAVNFGDGERTAPGGNRDAFVGEARSHGRDVLEPELRRSRSRRGPGDSRWRPAATRPGRRWGVPVHRSTSTATSPSRGGRPGQTIPMADVFVASLRP
jgi:hypothetical protein